LLLTEILATYNKNVLYTLAGLRFLLLIADLVEATFPGNPFAQRTAQAVQGDEQSEQISERMKQYADPGSAVPDGNRDTKHQDQTDQEAEFPTGRPWYREKRHGENDDLGQNQERKRDEIVFKERPKVFGEPFPKIGKGVVHSALDESRAVTACEAQPFSGASGYRSGQSNIFHQMICDRGVTADPLISFPTDTDKLSIGGSEVS
jgi:hypothetical protein